MSLQSHSLLGCRGGGLYPNEDFAAYDARHKTSVIVASDARRSPQPLPANPNTRTIAVQNHENFVCRRLWGDSDFQTAKQRSDARGVGNEKVSG